MRNPIKERPKLPNYFQNCQPQIYVLMEMNVLLGQHAVRYLVSVHYAVGWKMQYVVMTRLAAHKDIHVMGQVISSSIAFRIGSIDKS